MTVMSDKKGERAWLRFLFSRVSLPGKIRPPFAIGISRTNGHCVFQRFPDHANEDQPIWNASDSDPELSATLIGC